MTPDAVLRALAIDEKFKMHFTALVSHLFLSFAHVSKNLEF
jgi:hypothetical protein